MKLKAVVDSLDGVADAHRDLYVEFDDNGVTKWKLDVEGLPAHPETAALASAHNRTKQRVRELSTEVGQLKEQLDDLPEDFDRDLYDRAVTEGVGGGGAVKNEAEIRREAADAARAAAKKEHDKELGKVAGERDRLKTRVERNERDKALDTALDEAKVIDPAYRAGAKAILSAQIKVVEHDGEWEALATHPDLGDIPVAEHVKTWAQTDQGKAFVGARESAGGGANGSPPGGTPPTSSDNPWKKDSLNITKQAQLRRENPELANKLMREAGVAGVR